MDISDEQLNEIERRCSAATDGPWTAFVEGRDFHGGSSMIRTSLESGPDIELYGATPADYDFIAAARADIPHLLAVVRAQKEWIREHQMPAD